MKKFAIVLAGLLIGGAAQAATATCQGSFLNYKFLVKAPIKAPRLSGKANILVTQSGSVLHDAALPIVSGTFEANQSLNFDANDGKSRFVVTSAYVSPGRYDGKLAMSGEAGGATVSATCIVR